MKMCKTVAASAPRASAVRLRREAVCLLSVAIVWTSTDASLRAPSGFGSASSVDPDKQVVPAVSVWCVVKTSRTRAAVHTADVGIL